MMIYNLKVIPLKIQNEIKEEMIKFSGRLKERNIVVRDCLQKVLIIS